MKPTKYLLPVAFRLAPSATSPAQTDSVARAFIDQASRNQQRQPQSQPRRQQQPKQQSNVPHQSKKVFDGTWLATQAKTNPEKRQTIQRPFPIIIRPGKAPRTRAAPTTSTPDKPFYSSIYELQRRWTYN